MTTEETNRQDETQNVDEKNANVNVGTAQANAAESQTAVDSADTEAAAAAEEAAPEVDPLEAAKAEIEELKKQALYKQAEFDNFRKRTMKEKADLILQGGEKTITAILPVHNGIHRESHFPS